MPKIKTNCYFAAYFQTMTNNDNQNFTFRVENKNRATKCYVLYIMAVVLLVAAGFYFISQDVVWPLFLLIAVAVLLFMFVSKLKPSYFEFVAYPDYFKVNYYVITSVMRDYQSIEVAIDSFRGYRIEKAMHGLKKTLTISTLTQFGIADYPSISISALSEAEIARLSIVMKDLLKEA